MSLLLGLIVGGALLSMGVGTGVVLRGRRSRQAPPEPPEPPAEPAPKVLGARGFSLELGDVIDIQQRSLWLRYAWLAAEGDEAVAAILFSGSDVVILQPGSGLRLCLTQEVELRVGEEVPTALELAGSRFERVRRLPVRLTALADSPTPPFDEAIFSELRGLSGEALWVLSRGRLVKAFLGRSLDASEVEYWGGSQLTRTG